MKKNIVVVAYFSTGTNFIDDIRNRGYNPVIVDVFPVGTEESIRPFVEQQKKLYASLDKSVPIIKDYKNYEELLEKVRAYNPFLVIAGSEFGVPYATRLAHDLGLPGTPVSRLPFMTEKARMHEALKEHGVRCIEGKIINSVEEAKVFFDSLPTEDFVIKWSRGAGTQGVRICHGWDEIKSAVEDSFKNPFIEDGKPVELLMQECIKGEEYIVNTVSSQGKHRVISIWHYSKIDLPGGYHVYNYTESINTLDVGMSALIRYAFDAVSAIGIVDGPVHGEYMIDERGPVLMEVNCRPMGATMNRKFLDSAYGHHETDAILDTYLYPERFTEESLKPYRPKRKAATKLFIRTKDLVAESAPIIQIAKRLRSYYSSSFDWVGRETFLTKTTDMENNAGFVTLLHKDEKVVMDDLNLLHTIEMKYPDILFSSQEKLPESKVKPCDLESVIKNSGCHGTTLVLSDRSPVLDSVMVANIQNLNGFYDSFDQGILDLTKPESFIDLESTVERIFTFTDKIKEGGRIIIPESTYANLPYGIEGMEILLKVVGLRIEFPIYGDGNVLVASVEVAKK